MRIGIFDSGYGGLTILSEIRRELPQYDYLYLGDNARAPYGTHSFEVIYRYTLQAVEYLFSQGCTLVILACNTASAKALRTIQQRDLPKINGQMVNNPYSEADRSTEGRLEMVNVLGVIRPTVEAVPAITRTGHIGILATPATVSSESYVLELEKIRTNNQPLVVVQQPCPMWVPLIEAGEHRNEGADYFVNKYLGELLSRDPLIDTLVLGCTHYPLLLPKIRQWIDHQSPITNHLTVSPSNGETLDGRGTNHQSPISIISQGKLVAESLADYLHRHPEYREQLSLNGTCIYQTTENADRFSQSASLFLNTPIQAEHIDL